MNIVGIIAEYNPMHNGHIYNIKKAKELTNADYCIIIMSGSFTEQGNICLFNKFDRARIAIENGADLVIELPTIYATSSSENFAKGAIEILNSLGISHLAFGSETNDITILETVANTYVQNEKNIIYDIKNNMKNGINSSQAYNIAINRYISIDITEIHKPNNILGIEYLKALISLESKIKPVLVHRLESSHNDENMLLNSKYASSTSIRKILSDDLLTLKEKINNIQNFTPKNTCEYILNNSYNTNEKIWENLKYEIIKLQKDGLKNIYGVDEGLESKLYKEALSSNSYNEYIFKVKSKRYTLSRIKRICVNILLNITKERYTKLSSVKYARVLKVKKDSTCLLSLISKNSTIPVITKVTDDILEKLDDNIKESIYLDILSSNIANTDKINFDYTNKIKQP